MLDAPWLEFASGHATGVGLSEPARLSKFLTTWLARGGRLS